MSYNLGTADNPLMVLVDYADGILDAIVRADTEAGFMAAAIYAQLFYETTTPVTDEDTGDVTQVGTGEYAQAKGVSIDRIGRVMLTAGTYDEEGTELTAPTFDERFHANIRLMGSALEQYDDYGGDRVLRWHKWSLAWTLGGADLTDRNADETGKTLQGVSLIDRASIRSPSRVWF